ncbi:PssD/Cps14F family polysaccharide biosynthesis glycosyltransferase [Aliivibrio fischeri]|uniref:PssD/Cps14F family polysaccharide biosynthesis glycosyltransferase n=1 Tax=Aliivibrio fischeri TaxID=668 RepID=UPI00084C362E|nr:PssD/Cps14F family polysaccharide biosynthesis glycosyltransferase [Aliivibrio fischeri]OED52111.1 hypothetical protein BEI47_09820 [Aliivibrio fischeri]
MKNIAIVFGCGGHRAQANRFYKTFSQDEHTDFYGITDEGQAPDWSKDFLVLEPFRDKYSGKNVSPVKFISNIVTAYKFLRDNNISTLVSFGPGVAIFVGIAAKIAGCSIIHFETWSKFYSPTMTTKVMKYLTKNIFIQNIELKDSVPYGKFVGRF